jgi:hypothetical protein
MEKERGTTAKRYLSTVYSGPGVLTCLRSSGREKDSGVIMNLFIMSWCD